MATLKILLVEDHENWQKILYTKIIKALTDIGYVGNKEIRVYQEFQKAWDSLYEECPWDLLVTDIGLGIESQQKLGKYLVEAAIDLHIPAIIVSGTPVLSRQEVSDLITEYHANGFFSKSEFDVNKFTKKISDILKERIIQNYSNPNMSND